MGICNAKKKTASSVRREMIEVSVSQATLRTILRESGATD
jgi:hypothetical protein